MTHYICKGGKCKTVSEKPSVCLDPSCASRYKLLEECNCGNPAHHHHNKFVQAGSSSGRIRIVNFGLAVGTGLGLSVFVLGIAGTYIGWGTALIDAFSSLYLGFNTTLMGSVAGGLWGFIDGFILGSIVAWVYNFFGKIR